MSNEDKSNALSTVTNAVTDLVTDGASSLPAPIRRNAFKALDRLCTALMDLPVAYLEGKAAERRAETQARMQLISASTEQIAHQIDVDPKYALLAGEKYARRIVQEQINLDKICDFAAQEIEISSEKATSSEKTDDQKEDADSKKPEISDDWLDNFRKEACGKSNEEMQILFGKILAGEVTRPESFSIRTVKIMGQLDSRAASLFRRLCSLCVSMGVPDMILDSRVPSLGTNAGQNGLKDYGLTFSNLNILQEYGLIISDFNSYMDYRPAIARNNRVGLALNYCNTHWGLVPEKAGNWPVDKELRISGVQLTNSGRELQKIVEIEPDEKYTSALTSYFLDSGLQLTTVTVM